MRLSSEGARDEAGGIAVLHAALDAGVRFFDTADAYCRNDGDVGHNERLLRRALGAWSGGPAGVTVATKGGLRRPKGAWTNDGRPKHIREACEKSLRALETGQIFLYQFHAPDPSVPFAKSVETFAELQREGKVKHVGLSNVSVKEIDSASKIVEIASVQNRLNPFFRESLEDGVVAECERRGITFLAYSPLGGGRLTKRLPGHPVLQEIARKHGASPHALTIAWVRSKGTTVVPIPAARTEDHARDSARSIDLTLTAAEITAIDDADFSRA